MNNLNLREKLKSLKYKFPIISFFTYLILILVVLIACYIQFHRNMERTYEILANEVLHLSIDEINIDSIPGYLSGDYDKEEYERTQEALNRYAYTCDEVYYLYAYHITEEDDKNAIVIFDTPMPYDEGNKLGDIYELEADIQASIQKMRNGEQLDPFIDHTEYGYLMTCSIPLIDSDGECQGYLFADFNMDLLNGNNLRFILILFLTVFVLTLFILSLSMKAVSVRITEPIEKIYRCLNNMSYKSDADRKRNIKSLEELDINTNPEIQSLYDTLLKTMRDGYTYMKEYHVATEKLGLASEMAYNDALTGFGNKNAYEKKKKKLQEAIDNGIAEFSIIVMDINNLKYINDTFGHERGDDYIKGCCEIVRECLVDPQVYRIGGDEFVIVMTGEDYKNCQKIYIGMTQMFYEAYSDEKKDPWERYSASIGLSNYFPYDRDLMDVFNRADSAMYYSKSQFKERFGSYR